MCGSKTPRMPITGKRSSKLRRLLLAACLFLACVPAFAQSGTVIKPKKLYDVVYATAYADSGTGATGACWALTGSNPVAAALAGCPSKGCDIILGDGCYTMGSSDPAVTIPVTTSGSDQRVYRIIGQGKDKSILNYSGTGTAIRHWQDHTGTPGSSRQSNANELKGFAIRQTGTTRTGTASRTSATPLPPRSRERPGWPCRSPQPRSASASAARWGCRTRCRRPAACRSGIGTPFAR